MKKINLDLHRHHEPFRKLIWNKQENAMSPHKNSLLICLMLAFFLAGCSHNLTLKNLKSQRTLKGRYDTAYSEITVTMPGGDILKGKYRPATDHPFPTEKQYNLPDPPPKSGFGSGLPHGLRADVYAFLNSEKTDLMMEVFLGYDSFKGGDGFGFARTNDKRTYKIKY